MANFNSHDARGLSRFDITFVVLLFPFRLGAMNQMVERMQTR